MRINEHKEMAMASLKSTELIDRTKCWEILKFCGYILYPTVK